MATMLIRPQPLGIHPLPTGYLLLPAASASETALAALLRGERPAELPVEWQFYGKAMDDALSDAMTLLNGDNSPVSHYNRFILAGTPADYSQLKNTLPAALQPFLAAAAYTMGIIDQAPDAKGVDGELRAHLLLIQATSHLEDGNINAALSDLTQAIEAATVSPLFQAQLIGTWADIQRDNLGVNHDSVARYRQALKLLGTAPLPMVIGNLWLNLGTTYQELGLLQDAAKAYQETLRSITRSNDPQAYALAQNNLALTYLAAPMLEASDQLRAAVAISALREALTVYTQATYPFQWASAQLNLANALQYLPSSHPEENLAEAVRLYEDLYAIRTRANDPLGYARVRANQGNALAHLGIFDHATTNLREAQTIFREHGEHDAADAIDANLSQFPVTPLG